MELTQAFGVARYLFYIAMTDLSRSQFGFRKARSTVDVVNIVVKVAAQAIEGIMVTLDIRNVFNTARWDRIIKALIGFGELAYLVRIIRSYFSKRVLLCESSEGVFSPQVTGGVPKGSVLGQLLWNAMKTGYFAYHWLRGTNRRLRGRRGFARC